MLQFYICQQFWRNENTLIVDQAKTSSRLLYFGPGQQLKAEAKHVSARHWSMKYTQVPNFILRHFLISESANCPFLLCSPQDGTHQEEIWKHFHRQSSLPLSFRVGISAVPASQTSREGSSAFQPLASTAFLAQKNKGRNWKPAHSHVILRYTGRDTHTSAVEIPAACNCSLLTGFNSDNFTHKIWKAYKIECICPWYYPTIRTLSPESIPLAMHIFKTHNQSSLAFFPDLIRAFLFMLYHH